MRSTRVLFVLTSLIASTLLVACGGGGGGASLPMAQPNSPQSVGSTHTQAAVVAASTNCTQAPVKGIRASVSSLTVVAGGQPGSFIVCTQYFTKFTVSTGFNGSIISYKLTPSTPMNDVIYTATVTVNGLTPGSTSMTISDKKDTPVTVNITVLGPLSLACPGVADVGGTGVSCTVTNPGFQGTYTFAAPPADTTCNTSLNGFMVSDTVAESCTVTLTPTGPQSAAQQTIQFAGPLTLTCTTPAAVGATGAACTYSNPDYSGDYKFTKTSGGCTLAGFTITTLTITDSTAEDCTISLTPTPASGSETGKTATIHFEGPLTLACGSAGATGTSVPCSFSYPGYSGSYSTSVDMTNTCSATTPSNNSFTVTDSAAETCTVTLTTSDALAAKTSAPITFSAASGLGPISVSCPNSQTKGSTAGCTYTNPNYTGGYTTMTSSGTCSLPSAPSNGAFSVSDSAAENCTVTLTTSPDNGETPGKATINFTAPSGGGGGGGGGGGCAKTHKLQVKNGKTGFVVVC